MRPERKARNKIVKKKKGNNTLIIGAAAVILLAAIAFVAFNGGSSSDKEDSAIKFPDYVYTDALALSAYTYVTKNPEILEQIPCFCGCGGHSGHRFLRDCFIHDDWTYDEHARYCDVCIGLAMKTQNHLESGKTLKETRALIDKEFGIKYADGRTNTPPVSDDYKPILTGKLEASPAPAPVDAKTTPQTDLSSLSLPDNFKSLSDGLKFIPAGISWAYFTNVKQGTGIEQGFMPGQDFYGTVIIGMLNLEYSDGSFVELHDIGKSLANVKSNAGNNIDNILSTRPFIYSTKDRTNGVMALLKEPGNANAYNSYKSLLEKVDDENAGFAKINTIAPSFADVSYIGLIKSGSDVTGEIAFNIKDKAVVPLETYNNLKNSSSGRGFRSYDILMQNNTLIIRMTSNMESVISEATKNYGIEI
ncbi:MAG: PCYCGC domain-containing protein [Euryarchaeota archaeon]|nr:PCYCGC domain-containing protein [Euryarchaeota archaeon]MCG2737113.1 PCYCGC domain-containing protein [Candidatus Methanoperedenaceae archaeon]